MHINLFLKKFNLKANLNFDIIKKLFIGLSILGFIVSLYLVYVRFTGGILECGISSCGIVNNSDYSMFLGVPVAFWGLIYYLGVCLILLFDLRKFLLFSTLIGVLFSAYLTYLEAFVIKAWCQWCVLSAWIAVCLFILSLILYLRSRNSTLTKSKS